MGRYLSINAINWAFGVTDLRSSAKFLLVALAQHANDQWECWPSCAALQEATNQDRKTVLANLKLLLEASYLSDTGVRKGSTKSVTVYRLHAEAVPKTEHLSSTENGTCPKNEAVPNFPVSSPNFPDKVSQISREAVPNFPVSSPKNGTRNSKGTVKELSVGTVKELSTREALPGWLPADAWEQYVQHRKDKRSKLTDNAQRLCIRDLEKLKEAGQDPRAVIEQSISNGWTGLFPLKNHRQQVASASTWVPPEMRSGAEKIIEAERV